MNVHEFAILPEISGIFKKYNIYYNREKEVITINEPISVQDFIYLKNVLKQSGFAICDIIVGEGIYHKI